jgi:hypothetical protein
MAAVQLALLWIAYRHGYAGAPALPAYLSLSYLLFAVVGCGIFVAFVVRLALAREPSPAARVIEAARSEWPRLLFAILGLHVLAIGLAAFTALKVAIPAVSPFWLDLPLARAEASLGVAPWQLSHALLGWATPAIDLVYWTWFLVVPAVLYSVMLSKPSARKSQALVTYSLIVLVLGICGAYLLASVGPIFYDRVFGTQVFSALVADLSPGAPRMMVAQQLLWDAYSSHSVTLGNGISAMPSIHVALAMWVAMVAQGTRFSIPARIYFALIWIGSVHLGWHYFSDGLVAGLGVLALWKAAPFLIAPRLKLAAREPMTA